MNYRVIKIRQILYAIILFAAFTGMYSCEKYSYIKPTIDPEEVVSFQTDIQPIFTANCKSCHGAIQIPDLRPGNAYESLTKDGYVDLPAESSKLYTMMIRADHASRSTDIEKQKVLIWISQGALNNKK